MSEVNVFLSAIHAAVQTAIATAVAEATKPLIERITALENNPAIGTDTVLEQRLAVLEEVRALDEDKVQRMVDSAVEEALDQHCVSYDHDNYDSLYEEWGGESADEFMKDGDISDKITDIVNETLNNASFSISI